MINFLVNTLACLSYLHEPRIQRSCWSVGCTKSRNFCERIWSTCLVTSSGKESWYDGAGDFGSVSLGLSYLRPLWKNLLVRSSIWSSLITILYQILVRVTVSVCWQTDTTVYSWMLMLPELLLKGSWVKCVGDFFGRSLKSQLQELSGEEERRSRWPSTIWLRRRQWQYAKESWRPLEKRKHGRRFRSLIHHRWKRTGLKPYANTTNSLLSFLKSRTYAQLVQSIRMEVLHWIELNFLGVGELTQKWLTRVEALCEPGLILGVLLLCVWCLASRMG